MKKVMFAVLVAMVMSMAGIAIAHEHKYDDSHRLTSLTCEDYFETKLQYIDTSDIPFGVRSEVKKDNEKSYGWSGGIQNITVMHEDEVLFLRHSSLTKGTVTAFCDVKIGQEICYVTYIDQDTSQSPVTKSILFKDLDRKPFYRVIEGFCSSGARNSAYKPFCDTVF